VNRELIRRIRCDAAEAAPYRDTVTIHVHDRQIADYVFGFCPPRYSEITFIAADGDSL